MWVLEGIAPGACEHKQKISSTLALLHGKGLRCVHPCLALKDKESFIFHGNGDWQIRPYVEGFSLPRPSYALDRWRGKACADFLAALREKAWGMPFREKKRPFSLVRFVREMSCTMERYDPVVLGRLAHAFEFVEREFAGLEEELPIAFCHGDFHPLNLIWSEDGIRSVIDWEFLGPKPEVYDLATLIGCVGFEAPAGLARGLVTGLIERLMAANVLSSVSWRYLPEWVIAIRFAWLSDWLRRRDEEMVDLEVAYINLLLDNRRALGNIWRQAG